MMGDEYGAFLGDLSDYLLRVYLPRVCVPMEPLNRLPQLSSLGFGYRSALALAEALADPDVALAVEALQKAGKELRNWRSRIEAFAVEVE